MKLEVTYSVKTGDDELSLDQLDKDLMAYNGTDMELIDVELADYNEAHVTFEMTIKHISEIPDELYDLNKDDSYRYTSEILDEDD